MSDDLLKKVFLRHTFPLVFKILKRYVSKAPCQPAGRQNPNPKYQIISKNQFQITETSCSYNLFLNFMILIIEIYLLSVKSLTGFGACYL
jgi:hypothetical protein